MYALPGKPRLRNDVLVAKVDERASLGEQGLDAPPLAHDHLELGEPCHGLVAREVDPTARRYRGQPLSRALGPGCAYPPVPASARPPWAAECSGTEQADLSASVGRGQR